MQLRSTVRAALWVSLLGAFVGARLGHAQYGGGAGSGGVSGSGLGGTQDMFSSAEDTSVQSRYNKAAKGKNLNEWVTRLNDDDPSRRLDAVKSLGDSNNPKAIDYLIQA